MREILFRGKRVDNGEWVEGDSLIHSMYKKGDVCIGVTNGLGIYSVDEETIGQYTGLTDKNGKKIFEGDIVRDTSPSEYRLLCDSEKNPKGCIGVVKFGHHKVPSDDPFCWGEAYGYYIEGDTMYPTLAQYKPYSEYGNYEIEIIGNIYDNPELLKEDGQ